MRGFELFRTDFSKPPHRGCPTPKRAKKAKNRFLILNCTLFVRQYDILSNKWGDFMTKGIGNKRYTPEFKKIVVETMREEGLSYKETRLRFEIAGEDRVRNWERIYLEEGPEGLAVERRGRKITGRPRKLPQSTEEDLIAENQRLRAEVAYLKNLQALVLEDERRQQKKRWQSKI